MKKLPEMRLLLMPLLLVCKLVQSQPGGWVVDPSPYQYSMTMVAQIRIDGVPNHQMNNHLAVFSKGQIRAYGTPVAISGQAYYFLNIYSNIYLGDTLYFRAYIGADNKIYESADTAVFRHHLALGNLSVPFQIRLNLGDRPLIYTLPEINYQANSCPEVLDIQASDKQNSEGNGLTYSISGGADAARFGVNPQSGLLSWFNFTPDFTAPQDANGDNRYEVDVKVTDASNLMDVQHITVTVVNTVPLPPLVCPPNIALLSSSDGLGNCGASSNQTAISLSNPCAAGLLSYKMSGATSAGGTGLVPPALVFAVGVTTVYYFQAGYECPFTVTVTDDEPPAITCPANQTVSPTIVAPCSAVVSGIDALFNDNCNNAALAYTLSGATSGNGSGQAGGLSFAQGLTTVTYTATDGSNLESGCTFTVTVGACNANTVFSGTIKWEHDGVSGVQNATVNLTGDASGNDLTDVNGDYLISIPFTTGNFTLKPVKNINKLNGLTSADATAIQQHVTSQVLLSGPFKRIAADVNKSNSITTTDASLISQVLQGNPQANAIFNTSWRFVPSSYSFPNPNVPWGFPEQIVLTGVNGSVSGQDFKGIKLGDVATTWANPANFGAGEPLVFRVQDRVLEAGSEVTAEFRADQLNDLNSFQFALHFNPDQLRLTEIEPLTGLPVSVEDFGTYNLNEGEIRVVWSQAMPVLLREAAPVFRLHFKALESGARLSEVLRLNEEVLPGYVYNSKYAESGVELRYSESTATNPDIDGSALWIDNQPNPFVDATTLRFMLPQAGEAELQITDAAGRLLFSQNKFYAAGQQIETLRLEGVRGVLFAELVTGQGSVVRKMLSIAH